MPERNNDPNFPLTGAFNAVHVLESISDAFFALDADWRFLYVNDQSARVMARTREELFGKRFWGEFPGTLGSPFEQHYRQAMNERVTVTFEEFYAPLDVWVEVRVYPSPSGISVFYQDITARKAAEEDLCRRAERERLLLDLSRRAQALTDPNAVIADAMRSLGLFLGVARCVFADIDLEADECTIPLDYCADDAVVSLVSTFPISAFGSFVVAEYRAGRVAVVDDVRADPVKVPPQTVAAYEAIGVRAYVAAPVLHSARLVSAVAVHSAVPRVWRLEEVELVQAVVERTWLNVEVLRQQQALAREAEELRAAHQRTTTLLESITDAFYAIDREWRFTYLNAQAERLLFRPRAELLGQGIWEAFPESVGGTFYHLYHRAMDEGVPATIEDYYAPLDAWFEVRAYPSTEGLSVYFHDISERKALEAERAQIAEREHRIAEQLQAALTPEVPQRIAGMALAKHYEAALAEAGVGGDFYDVFPVDKGCTALVVGDLSGKGLAAASQVATLRNMLRYALYRARTLAGALGGLNELLAEQGLLSGFATLFVGAYDSGAGTLTYANCGQEPALLRRASSGHVERLEPTGAVLGSFEGAFFDERTVILEAGDALAVFTDGMTEVGQSRTQMLGINGMADLLAEAASAEQTENAEATQSAEMAAEHLVRRLVAGVDAAAQGGVMRDDICLLVAVVE